METSEVIITVRLAVPAGYADPTHDSGLTEEGHADLSQSLIGWDFVDGPTLVVGP